MKLFRTSNIETVSCQTYFGFALPRTLWAKRVHKFELQFNTFYVYFVQYVQFVLYCTLSHLLFLLIQFVLNYYIRAE